MRSRPGVELRHTLQERSACARQDHILGQVGLLLHDMHHGRSSTQETEVQLLSYAKSHWMGMHFQIISSTTLLMREPIPSMETSTLSPG